MTLQERDGESIVSTYRRLQVEIERGEGVYLTDVHGTLYLDLLAGVAVNALGYGNRRLVEAIANQSLQYIHVSNFFAQEPQVRLAEKLRTATGFARAFFCNSGTEANEAALKLVRKWGSARGKSHIIGMHNSFHGRTMGSLSMMQSPDYKDGFGPFLDHCTTVPFNDSNALRSAATGETAAVILECIQGEGGIVEAQQQFVDELLALRSQHGFLVVADEVQAGIGRTGKFLSCEHYGLRPDVVTLAKPLGGGLPLGALLLSEELMDVLKPGNHGTTFGGNPVACAAGLVVLEEVLDNGLMKKAADVGEYFRSGLESLQQRHPDIISEIRGKGLMLGAELTFPGKSVAEGMLAKHVILNCTHGNVLRFVPPLIIEKQHVDYAISVLERVLVECHEQALSAAAS